MALIISDEEIKRTGLSEQNLRIEIACRLFQLNALTGRQAATFAGIHYLQMLDELWKRKISLNDSEETLIHDVETLRSLRNAGNK